MHSCVRLISFFKRHLSLGHNGTSLETNGACSSSRLCYVNGWASKCAYLRMYVVVYTICAFVHASAKYCKSAPCCQFNTHFLIHPLLTYANKRCVKGLANASSRRGASSIQLDNTCRFEMNPSTNHCHQ